MTWLDIKDWFRRELGDSGYVTLYEQNGKPNGIATIEVNQAHLLDDAVDKLNGVDLHNRKIICRRETPRDYDKCMRMDVIGGRKRSPTPPPRERMPPVGCTVTPYMLEQAGFQGPVTDSVYVHNLKFEVRWQQLKDLFRRAGNVIKADIAEDKDGKPRGFATVRFEQPFEALIAVAMFHNQSLDGREMRVRMDKEGGRADPHRPVFPNTSRGAAAAAEFMAQMTRRINSRDRDEARIAASVSDLMLYSRPSRPMPHDGYGPPPMMGERRGMGMMMDGPPRGYGPVPRGGPPMGYDRGGPDYEYATESRSRRRGSSPPPFRPMDEGTESLLRAAIAGGMPPTQVERYAVQLGISPKDLARIRDTSEPRRSSKNESSHSHTDTGSSGNQGGITGKVDEDSAASTRVMVRNIPLAFTDRDLEHYFAGFGQLKDARICVDANRRSLGYGFVEYYTNGDAKMACTRMNGYTIDGMPMRVAFS